MLGRKTDDSENKAGNASAMTMTGSAAVEAGGSRPLSILERSVRKIAEPYVHTVSGGLAGAVSAVVSCPLDVIKTKLQAQGGFRGRGDSTSALATAAYRGVKGTARVIWHEEGLRGLYRGLGPMLLGYVPTWAVYLTVYNRTQQYFSTKTDNKFLVNTYASLCGGASSTMATNPIWVIKTRLMSQSKANGSHVQAPWHYRNTLDAAVKMYRHEGMRSFYSGLTPALLGLTHVAIQFPLYEVLKARFTGIAAGERETSEDRARHFWGLASAVFMSKVVASTATYPHEVVRTRLQTQQRSHAEHHHHPGHAAPSSQGGGGGGGGDRVGQARYRGTAQTCKAILAEEGWRGFYAGLGTNLIRAVPSAMTTLLAFEYVKRAILDAQESARAKTEQGA